ncbi:MAG TPA: hypothetical protein VLM16_03055 [Ginsengibacter sp.]|nr:hypothetical protein [Ginsengibacter sp.]
MTLYNNTINNYFFFVVSADILVVSADILVVSADILDESEAIGAIVESFVTVVESEEVSVVEEPPQAASNAEVQTITSNFFILI